MKHPQFELLSSGTHDPMRQLGGAPHDLTLQTTMAEGL